MQVVSGPLGRERVHFKAPSAERLGNEMTHFLAWFNEAPATDPVLKAGLRWSGLIDVTVSAHIDH